MSNELYLAFALFTGGVDSSPAQKRCLEIQMQQSTGLSSMGEALLDLRYASANYSLMPVVGIWSTRRTRVLSLIDSAILTLEAATVENSRVSDTICVVKNAPSTDNAWNAKVSLRGAASMLRGVRQTSSVKDARALVEKAQALTAYLDN